MIFYVAERQKKPDRLIPEDQKDEQYHLDYGRWVAGRCGSKLQKDRINRFILNRHFYKGDQWVLPEDTVAFLKDDLGYDTGRIQMVQNYIQPTVEQYRGNAERMDFNYKVYSLSPLAKKRRDNALAKLLAYQAVSEIAPAFGDYLRNNNFPMGRDETETEMMFDRLYTDTYVISVNRFARAVENINDLDKYKTTLARDIALGGMGVLTSYIHAGDWRFRRVPLESFAFDTSAIEPDLSDANFFLELDYLNATSLFERYQDLDSDDRKIIESIVSDVTNSSKYMKPDSSDRIPVYTASWRDVIHEEYGYVEDDFGQRVLRRINYVEPGDDEPQYTKDDVISVDKLTNYQKQVLGGESTAMLYADLWRFCKFIPREVASSKKRDMNKGGIILDKGVIPYQETNNYRSTNMMPPYMVGIWSYLDGDVIAPVDVMINPQRMVNRFMSAMERQINNSGVDGVVYDKDIAGAFDEDETELVRKIKQGDPVGVHAKQKGIQNVVGKYQASNIYATEAYSRLTEQIRTMMEQMTGVNEAIKGQPSRSDQLVGTMQLMIQRGSLIQEPFYKAISDIFKRCYQNIVSAARRFYIDNDIDLYDFVGEESTEVIRLSKDVRNENMAVGIRRVMDYEQEKQVVDQTIYQWLQFQLIDQETASKLLGRSTMEEALEALRQYQKRLQEQRRIAEQQQEAMIAQQQQQQQQVAQEARAEQGRQEAREDTEKDLDRATELAKTQARRS